MAAEQLGHERQAKSSPKAPITPKPVKMRCGCPQVSAPLIQQFYKEAASLGFRPHDDAVKDRNWLRADIAKTLGIVFCEMPVSIRHSLNGLRTLRRKKDPDGSRTRKTTIESVEQWIQSPRMAEIDVTNDDADVQRSESLLRAGK